MTQQKRNPPDGHGGSYVIADDAVVKREGTLNPGDPGYQEAVRKAPVQDSEKRGTLSRVPTFRDLDERPRRPSPAKPIEAPAPAFPAAKGGSK